ncbi:hypothetical protein [Streptomyces odonnellii]|uniref:hypothetical protein n=1 Tax=Streptomyces odonnellii TaxID=1417980 RepID=UPI0012FEE951
MASTADGSLGGVETAAAAAHDASSALMDTDGAEAEGEGDRGGEDCGRDSRSDADMDAS